MRNLILFLTLCICSCNNEKIEYIYSPDKQSCISKFEYIDNKGISYTILTHGKVETTKLPKSYIIARNWGRDPWHGLIKWQGKDVLFYQPYSSFETYNPDESYIHIREMYGRDFFKYYYDKLPHSYIKVSNEDEL